MSATDPARDGESVSPTEAVRRLLAWTDEAMPEATGESFLLKARHEWQELLDDPDDPVEAADVVACLIAGWHRRGVALFDVLHQKVVINEVREWELLPDGTYQHVAHFGGPTSAGGEA